MMDVKRTCWAVLWVVACGQAAWGGLAFAPAAGWSATELWRGANAAHLAFAGDALYVYGTEAVAGGGAQIVVRRIGGSGEVEIARSSGFAAGAFSPDAMTALGDSVYWVSARSFAAGGAATLYRTAYDGSAWQTAAVFDVAAGINVYSLSTDGVRVFGVGLDPGGMNVAFYLDDNEQYRVLATLPTYSGGSGFDPAGNFYAGSVDESFASHTYRLSAAQVRDRVLGVQTSPYGASDADAIFAVPDNASAVMESDGSRLFGAMLNATFSGTNPYAYELATGASALLGTLNGAATAVTTDCYARDGAVYFLAKDNWVTGGEGVVYRLVPEPSAIGLLTVGVGLLLRRARAGRKP